MKKRRKIEEKTTTYTASDLPEEIHSGEPAKDAETTGNADTVKNAEMAENAEPEVQVSPEVERQESAGADSEEKAETMKTESAEDTEGKDSELSIEKSKAEESNAKETTKESPQEEDPEKPEKGGFTRGKLIKIFAMEVLAFVIFIFAIIAWFSMNDETSATGMQIKVETPGGIYVSLGKSNNHYADQSTDYLDLDLQSGAVVAPTASDPDWTSDIEIDKYYKFGKMIPASSTSGEHIYFTPDAISAGRDVESGGRYFQADGNTDGYLKYYVENETFSTPETPLESPLDDTDSLAATAHAFNSEEASNKPNAWSDYNRKLVWNDTNDDGYYVDIPVWLKSSEASTVNLKVKGIVKRGPNTNSEPASGDTTEPLYKATRVALLNGTDKTPLGSVTNSNTDVPTVTSILPLRAASSFDGWSTGTLILDSYNYTTTSRGSSANPQLLYGVSSIPSGTTTAVYSAYTAYDDSTTTIITLTSGTPTKIWIRVWLDGEDKGCWNPNAGQDWTISLKFEKVE